MKCVISHTSVCRVTVPRKPVYVCNSNSCPGISGSKVTRSQQANCPSLVSHQVLQKKRTKSLQKFLLSKLIHECSRQVSKVVVEKMKLLSQLWVSNTADKSCFLCPAAFLLRCYKQEKHHVSMIMLSQ